MSNACKKSTAKRKPGAHADARVRESLRAVAVQNQLWLSSCLGLGTLSLTVVPIKEYLRPGTIMGGFGLMQ
jgi:hypothetical protein